MHPCDRGSLARRVPDGSGKWVMFKILELSSEPSASPIEVGDGFATRADAMAAIRRHLKGFIASGHNAEAGYWWARNGEGLHKCWISVDRNDLGEASESGRPRS